MKVSVLQAINLFSARLILNNDKFLVPFNKAYLPQIMAHSSDRDFPVSLGQHMREIFRSYDAGDRSQSSVSKAGIAWELLCALYLTACFKGTDAAAVHRSHARLLLPSSVREALRVTISGKKLVPDNDIIVLVWRGEQVPEIKVDNWKRVPKKRIDGALNDPSKIQLFAISCKTTFNDQINAALFWDMIYRRYKQDHARIAVGGRAQLSQFYDGQLRTALFTVPSQNKVDFNATSAPVVKGQIMSGGVYWGRPTVDFIESIDRFFPTWGIPTISSKWSEESQEATMHPWPF
ncbi:hypothetical protein [Tepidiforma bonchosmolovskayae]|uniref:BsaWI restriction endonuclease type 2 domain-containing protein n=1 Tax=Tepidiforma bonchosmolovskayae TaxID=2601677 RepID=A0ABX6C0E6_9CHLR|nr:hypothetical protein [Tepidiforma bonchosmolovskayae]QFG02744.1 hypothetical protein Tbon_05380 [Tepidiforma bonchosmolovskayae]